MTSHGITQPQLADAAGRTQSYISERVNGLRALDTSDIDALAELVGVTGAELLFEITRRARERLQQSKPDIPRIGLAAETAPLPKMLAAYRDGDEAGEIDGPHSDDA